MAVADQLERYLKGIPLTDELAALLEGKDEEETLEVAKAFAESPAKVLDDDDREHLRRMVLEPGWAVMNRLLDAEFQRYEDGAKAISMADPLGRREEVANQWAYVAMLRRAKNLIAVLVDQEIQKLAKTI